MRWTICVTVFAVLLGRSALAVSNDRIPADSGVLLETPIRLPPVLSPHSVVTAGFEWEDSSGYDPATPARNSLEWSKGGIRIVPYGAFWADMVYASSRTNTSAYTLWVFSAADQGESTFVIDGRRSRFGLNVDGPRIPALDNAKSQGQVEIDFQGAFVTENLAGVLLRQAYWEVKNDSFRLLVGQHWDVISPLYPATLNYPVGWDAGNIGFRRVQFRGERYLAVSNELRLTLQASVNQDIIPDFPTDPGVRREPSNWPVVEGRFAFGLGPEQSTELGVSAHIGETGFDFLETGPPPLNLPPKDDARFQTWSFNVDFRSQITTSLSVQAEFFTGANLSPFLGGIGQGICPCTRLPIRSTGGWLDLGYDWTPQLYSHVGFGIDDPLNADFLFGRTYNQFIFANLSFDLAENLTTGIEVTAWKTLYQETRAGLVTEDMLIAAEPGKAVTIDWMVKYSF